MWGNHMGYMFGGGFMWMWWFLLVVVVITVMALMWSRSGNGSVTRESAGDILKKRYARGEITRDQFNEMKKEIEA